MGNLLGFVKDVNCLNSAAHVWLRVLSVKLLSIVNSSDVGSFDAAVSAALNYKLL